MRRTRLITFLMTLPLLGVVLLHATPARATYPGTNGKIAFSTDFGDDPQIFTVNPDGSGETQITSGADGHATNPDWSPDGTKIVFQGDATGEWQIYVMNPNGVTANSSPSSRGSTIWRRGSPPTARGSPSPDVRSKRLALFTS